MRSLSSLGCDTTQDVILTGDLVELTLDKRFSVGGFIEEDRIRNRSVITEPTCVVVTGHEICDSGTLVRKNDNKVFLYEITTSENKLLVSPHEIKFISARDGSTQEERRAVLVKLIDDRLSGIERKRFETILLRKLGNLKFKQESDSPDVWDDTLIDCMTEMSGSPEHDK